MFDTQILSLVRKESPMNESNEIKKCLYSYHINKQQHMILAWFYFFILWYLDFQLFSNLNNLLQIICVVHQEWEHEGLLNNVRAGKTRMRLKEDPVSTTLNLL